MTDRTITPPHRPEHRPDRRLRPRLVRALALASALALAGFALSACGDDDPKKIDGTTSTSAGDGTSTTVASDQPDGDDTGTGSGSGNGGGSDNSGDNSGGGTEAAAPAFGRVSTPENIDCHNGNFQEFTASWTTTNATRVTISIDGPGVYAEYPANGEASLPFNCSSSHTFLFTAYNADGVTATRTITLDPRNVQSNTPDTPDSSETSSTTT